MCPAVKGGSVVVPSNNSKLTHKNLYETPELGRTKPDVKMLKKIVPSTARALFKEKQTFRQQAAVVRAKATLYLKRMAPTLRYAKHHWAASCVLSKANQSIQATHNRREK